MLNLSYIYQALVLTQMGLKDPGPTPVFLSSNKHMELSILILTSNERSNLEELLPEILVQLNTLGVSHEIVIIDNHSIDGTQSLAESLGAIVFRQQEVGYGAALREGFEKTKGDYVITLDADCSHPAVMIQGLWESRENSEMVICSRYISNGSSAAPVLRRFLSKCLNLCFSKLLRIPIKDLSSGFRLYHRKIIQPANYVANGFDILIEILIRCFLKNDRIVEIPFSYRARRCGSSHAKLMSLAGFYLKTFINLWRLRNEHRKAISDHAKPDLSFSTTHFSWILFFVCILSYSYFFQSGQHNENARFDQIRAQVEDKSWAIDRFAHNSADIITYNGKVYSCKAPGLSYLGIPIWAASAWLLNHTKLTEPLIEHFICYLTIICVIGVFSAGLVVVIFRLLSQRIQQSYALVLALIYGFSTLAFPFSTLFFSHQVAAALLFSAFAILVSIRYRQDNPKGNLKPQRKLSGVFLAGLLVGFGVTVEYPIAIAAPWLGLYCVFSFRCLRTPFLFGVGLLVGVLPLALYNYTVFGKLFFSAYSVYAADPNSVFQAHRSGLLGITLPTLENLWLILFSAQRGLMVVNPIFMMLFVVIPLACANKFYRRENLVTLGIIFSFIAFNAAYGSGIMYAGGGASVGPRHLIPMLPFAVYLLVEGYSKHWIRNLTNILALISAFFMLLATATEPRLAYEISNPIIEQFFPAYLSGLYAFESNGVFSSQLITENSVAFNLAKLFGVPGILQLVPVLLFWWIVGSAIMYKFHASKKLHNTFAFLFLILVVTPVLAEFRNIKPNIEIYGLYAKYIPKSIWNSCEPSAIETKFSGRHVINRIDDHLNFDWDTGKNPLKADVFSAEWSGTIHIPANSNFSFQTESDDGSCLYIDDALIVDNWGQHAPQRKDGKVKLSAGPHRILVRYENLGLGGKLRVFWSKDHGPFMVVPPSVLAAE